MEERQVGPRAFQVYGYQSCMGCCYHDQRLVKSGMNPTYWHYCLHPSNPPEMMGGNITGSTGRLIGETHVTPDWCLVLHLPEEETKDILTREEVRAIADAFLDGRKGKAFTAEEADIVFEWARKARLAADLLELVLDGGVVLDVRDGEVVFFGRDSNEDSHNV